MFSAPNHLEDHHHGCVAESFCFGFPACGPSLGAPLPLLASARWAGGSGPSSSGAPLPPSLRQGGRGAVALLLLARPFLPSRRHGGQGAVTPLAPSRCSASRRGYGAPSPFSLRQGGQGALALLQPRHSLRPVAMFGISACGPSRRAPTPFLTTRCQAPPALRDPRSRRSLLGPLNSRAK